MAHLKMLLANALIATVWQYTNAGGYYGGGGGGGGGHGNAQSFAQFQGPVVGPAQPVSIGHGQGQVSSYGHGHGHDQSQGQSIDYIAYPKYNFGYGVTDYTTGDSHGQKESRDGDNVVGQYSLKEPGGNIRTVHYHADNSGFHAQVQNSGGNDHSGGAQHGHKY